MASSPLASPGFSLSFSPRYPAIYKNPVNMQDMHRPHFPARPSVSCVRMCARSPSGDLPESRENLPAPRYAFATIPWLLASLFSNRGCYSRGEKTTARRWISPRNNAFSHSFCALGLVGGSNDGKGGCAPFKASRCYQIAAFERNDNFDTRRIIFS